MRQPLTCNEQQVQVRFLWSQVNKRKQARRVQVTSPGDAWRRREGSIHFEVTKPQTPEATNKAKLFLTLDFAEKQKKAWIQFLMSNPENTTTVANHTTQFTLFVSTWLWIQIALVSFILEINFVHGW
jgi:hypothetical protein